VVEGSIDTCSPEKVPVPAPGWLTLKAGDVKGTKPLILSELELDKGGHARWSGTDHANSWSSHFTVFFFRQALLKKHF